MLEDAYFNYPKIPNKVDGRIVPFYIKGRTVYITHSQYEVLHYLFWTTIISFAVVLLVVVVNKISKPKKDV